MQKHYIVIGSSAAGLGAAGKLRSLDSSARITCVTAEKVMPYNRCLLADHLSGSRSAEQVATKPQSFFDENNITLMLNSRVVQLDAQAQTITLANGTNFGYDKLFLGTGRSSFVPNIPGFKSEGVFPFFDFDDVTNILAYIKQHNVKHATIVGAGLSGLECADALSAHGLGLTVVEREAHVLARQIDQAGAQHIASLMATRGITLLTSMSVQEIITHNNAVAAALLSNGTVIPTGMVIFAIGGKTNLELAQQANLVIEDGGIVTTPRMQTSNPTIFAGGDICRVYDLVTGGTTLSTLWPDAVQQGMVAAQTMVGIEKMYAGTINITSSNIFGTTFVTCGPTSKPAGFEQLIKKEADFYHRLLVHNGMLKGFIMVGNVQGVGQLRKAIVSQEICF